MKKKNSLFIDHNHIKSQKMVQNISFPIKWPFGAQGVGCRWAPRALLSACAPSSLLPQVTCSALTCCSPHSGRPSWTERRPWGPQAPNGQPWSQLTPTVWLFSEGGIVGCSSEQWVSTTNRHPLCSSGQPLIAGLKEYTTQASVKTFPNTGEEEQNRTVQVGEILSSYICLCKECVHTHTWHMYLGIYTHMYVYISMCRHIHMYKHKGMYICIHIIYTHIHIFVYIYIAILRKECERIHSKLL